MTTNTSNKSGNSRIIASNQADIHPRLEQTVRKHLTTEFRRPIPAYSQQVFDAVFKRIDDFSGPLMFDSYCGVGESTVHLAHSHPQALVIGLDKSAHRLNKHDEHYRQTGIDNYLLLRADVDDFWRLAQQANWHLHAHYLLYPNPWPKAAHFQRRCHGSPLFPTLLTLGGRLELRSNWQRYLQEFAIALQLAGHQADTSRWTPTQPVTPFERKYLESGQSLWRLSSRLD